MKLRSFGALALTLSLGACVTAPTGPSQLVLPGSGKNFQQFRMDDATCRSYAFEQIGGNTAEQAGADSVARSAVLGTAIGAVAGAAMGGSQGAGVGAGTGLLFGTAVGSGTGADSSYSAQRRYDNYYIQCMYASGHRVPVSGQLGGDGRSNMQQRSDTVPVAPPAGTQPPPPPPPGTPPPPPPGVRG